MSRTIKIVAALVGALLISVVSAGSASAVTVTVSCSPPGQLRSVDGGLACPVPNAVTFTADQPVDWKVTRSDDYTASSPLATGSGLSITYNAGPELVNKVLMGNAYVGGVPQGSTGVDLVDPADVPTQITMLSPASFVTPAVVALHSDKTNLTARLRGVQNLPLSPCFREVPPGTRCFFVGGEVGAGTYWVDATASSNTGSGQTDLASFPVQVTGSTLPSFVLGTPKLSLRRTGTKRQLRSLFKAAGSVPFRLVPRYSAQVRRSGRWVKVSIKSPKPLARSASADTQLTSLTRSLPRSLCGTVRFTVSVDLVSSDQVKKTVKNKKVSSLTCRR